MHNPLLPAGQWLAYLKGQMRDSLPEHCSAAIEMFEAELYHQPLDLWGPSEWETVRADILDSIVNILAANADATFFRTLVLSSGTSIQVRYPLQSTK